ncbi:MAG TPA: hypothetical protein VL463_27300 [Kofleriaceae bacterium]|jgi:hypothetical protein|nr:hypothetical protein [Kofleriaceae bacterium]
MIPDDDVERRAGVRGPVRDLHAELPGGVRGAVLEAGRKNVFVAHDDPDSVALGARIEITIVGAQARAIARCEVVRKEIQPRRGLALLIVHMAPAAETTYLAMLHE